MNSLSRIAISCLLVVFLVPSANGIGQVFCPTLNDLISRSELIILGDVEHVVSTYVDQPQFYSVPAQFQFNITVFKVNILRIAKGYSFSPIYVVGDETNSSATFNLGQRYVLFLSNLKGSCAPSPPYSLCTLPSTPTSSTFYIQGAGKFLVLNNTVYYGYQNGACGPFSK